MAVSGSKYWSSKREIEMQTNTQSRKHDDAIDWPNGMGFTPCTSAYAAKMRERAALLDRFDEDRQRYIQLTIPAVQPGRR